MKKMHNEEAEDSLLGAIMLDASVIDKARTLITPKDLYGQSNRIIYAAMQHLYQRGESIDAITLADALSSRDMLDAAGGINRLSRLESAVPSTLNAEMYIKIIARHAQRRRIAVAAERLLDEARGEKSATDMQEWLSAKQAELAKALTLREGVHASQPMKVAIRDAFADLQERMASDPSSYPSAPYDDLKGLIPYFAPGKLHLIAARPAMGKSALATCLAWHLAKEGHAVSFRSLEMSSAELAQRCLCQIGRVDSHRVLSMRLADDEWGRLMDAGKELADLPVWIDSTVGQTPAQVIEGLRHDAREHGCKVAFVDFFQRMRWSNSDGRREEMGDAINQLKDVAEETGMHIVVLSQLNRGVESRENKRPMMRDLKETSHLEEAADIVSFIYRDEVYNEHTETPGMAEVIVAKHRGGATGTARLSWQGRYTLFGDLAPDSAEGVAKAF